MTDIIERLRGSPFEWLADEIARRDAEIKRLTSERNDYEAEGRRHIKTIAELRAENARLLKDYATDSANKRLLSESERLRAELQQLTDLFNPKCQIREVVSARRELARKP